jgi:hypothetical protein
MAFLFLLVVVQFVALDRLVVATDLTNLLFGAPSAKAAAPDRIFLWVAVDTLRSCVFMNEQKVLLQYMGWLFLMTFLIGLALWQLFSLQCAFRSW